MKINLNITWLYPLEMSTYGDRGNILTLKKRCEWRGIGVQIEEIGLKEALRKDWTDLYFFGGGQDQAQIAVSDDLKTYKKAFLEEEASLGKVFLGVCGGYQLFGHYYRDHEGNELPGLGIMDVITLAGNKRLMGNLVVDTELFEHKLVGFENHSGKTFLGKKAKPLGKVFVGFGNNGEDRSEGAIQNNIFGCYIHGPLLPKNPQFADYLIRLALEKRYGKLELSFLNDTAEYAAHETAVQRAIKTR